MVIKNKKHGSIHIALDHSSSENSLTKMEPVSGDCNLTNTIFASQGNKKNKRKHHKETETQPSESEKSEDISNITSISEEDLAELRTTYKKCKDVIKKIETKYGHLLNVSDNNETCENLKVKCKCALNKKIIFDDDGQQITREVESEIHICPNKLKRKFSDAEINVRNLQVEYDAIEIDMPDDIQTLSTILQNPDIEITHRNKIIDKLRSLRQEFVDDIRFNKKSLVEKVKTDPDTVLQFKGTNLSSLPGYLY